MIVLQGALALGLLWSLATLGVYLSYRVLDIPDLTMEGSLVSGAAVSAAVLSNLNSPGLALLSSLVVGALAGFLTALLHIRLKIPALLSGILSMIGLYSLNIRIMQGAANISLLRQRTLFSSLIESGLNKNEAVLLCGGMIAAVVCLLLWRFLKSELGYAVRATGSNPHMARAQGIDTESMTVLGLVLSNALIGTAGALISQYLGFADVQMGSGAIAIGLASLIIGEVLFARAGGLGRHLVALLLGSILYRMVIAFVMELGMPATDLKLFTALTVTLALSLPRFQILVRRSRKEGTP